LSITQRLDKKTIYGWTLVRRTSQRLPYAFDIKGSKYHTKPSPLSAVHMEASDSCKIQVIIFSSNQPIYPGNAVIIVGALTIS
jgi:hypothetical protein